MVVYALVLSSSAARAVIWTESRMLPCQLLAVMTLIGGTP